jgi:hypothetical protein
MTLTLRCIRCGDWAEMDPLDPYGHGICCACFSKWLATDIGSPAFLRFRQRLNRNVERHPTRKALSAALDAPESTPHGTLVETAQ